MIVFQCINNHGTLWVLVNLFLEKLGLLLLPYLHWDINVPFYQISLPHTPFKLLNIGLASGNISFQGVSERILGLVFNLCSFRNVLFKVDFPIVDPVADLIFKLLYVI